MVQTKLPNHFANNKFIKINDIWLGLCQPIRYIPCALLLSIKKLIIAARSFATSAANCSILNRGQSAIEDST